MLFLVVILAALTAAQIYTAIDVISALSGQSQLTNFTTYLGLFPTLVTQIDAGNITADEVLAPSDEAFAKYWNSNKAASNDTDHLEAVLTYHLLQGIHADVFLDVPPQFIPTLLRDSSYTNVTGGQRVEAVSSGGRVNFYSAAKSVSHLIAPNILFTGGVINIIDSVLTPPLNLVTTATEVDLTGTFAILAGTNPDPWLLGDLDETSDWTFFVTNTTQLQYLNVTQQQLFAAEEYACVHGEVAYSSLLTDGKTLQTVLGSDVAITVWNGSIYVNAAKIVDPDYLLSNGVMHVLDRYLAFISLVLMSLIIDVGDHSALDPNNTSGPPSPTLSSAPTSVSTPMAFSSPHSSLSTGAKAGIGIGASLGGLVVIALAWYFIQIRKVVPMQRAEKREGPSASKLSQGGKRLVSELEGPGQAYEIG